MKNRPTRLMATALLFALGLSTTSINAEPAENRGKSQAQSDKHNQKSGKQHRNDTPDYDLRDYEHERDYRHVDIEEALIREIFLDQRSQIDPARSLPPGIQKNLARGKPIPPGIAKKFDGHLQSRLPSYPGYDWRQVGTDAVLIDATTGIIEAVIAGVLQ